MKASNQVNETTVFSVSDVAFSFSGDSFQRVFSDLSVEIKKGETFAVLGPSGVGKSLFLKMLIGLITPTEGRIQFHGVDLRKIASKTKFLQRVGMTFQQGGLFDSLTVEENLSFPLRELTDCTEKEIPERVASALDDVGLSGQQRLMVHEMSGGMQKRLGIARALLLHPEVVLYDDPNAGLDPVTARSINQLISAMKEKYRMTVLIVTSDPHQIFSMSDRIGFLYQGTFLEIGSVDNVRNSKNKVVEQFMNGYLDGPLTTGLK